MIGCPQDHHAPTDAKKFQGPRPEMLRRSKINRLAEVSLIFIAMIVALTIGGVVYADGPAKEEERATLTVGGRPAFP